MDCGSQCSDLSTNAKPAKYGRIDTLGLAALLSSGISFVLLDARSGKWDDEQRIGSAQTLSNEVTGPQAAKVIPTKQSLIVVYCSNIQCPASNNLAKNLFELGYLNILKYEEGIQEWVNSGQPVRKRS